MNTKATLGVGAVVIISLAIPLILFSDAESPEPSEDSFAAFDGELPERAGDAPAERAGEPPAANTPAAGSAQLGGAQPGEAVADTDDALNRPGPIDREVPAARTVKNVRPNPGLKPGLQGPPVKEEEVRSGVDAVRPVLRACYEELRGDFPDASGNITVAFQLIDEDGTGRVEMGEIKADGSTMFDEKFHDCVLEGIGDAEFAPPTTSPVSITYPFNFSGSDPEE